MLAIPEETFSQLYAGTDIINYTDIFYSIPKSDNEFIYKYLSSKLWRLNNIYTIIDKYGQQVIFRMNKAQHIVYSASLKHSRLIVLKSRQQGVSTLWIVSFFDDCLFRENFHSGLMAQGTDEAEVLLSKTKLLWDKLDPAIKNFLSIDIKKDNTKELSFTNGSFVFIRVSFRSATLQRLHISEFGKIANKYPERARETKTGTLQAIAPGNTTIIESTAEGEGIYKNMWDTANAYAGIMTSKDFMPIFLSWLNDPHCTLERYQTPTARAISYFKTLEENLGVKLTQGQKNFWIAQYRELGEDIFQEYPATAEEAFLKGRDGTYYAKLYLRLVRKRDREVNDLFDPNLPVQVAIDLGLNDYCVLLFFQTFSDGWRIINSYHNSGMGIEHYCQVMDKMVGQYNYNISLLILPHDASVRDLSTNITREQAFWHFGYKNTFLLDKTKSVDNDIEIVRQAMHNLWIDPCAQYIIDCFLNYTKEYDENRDTWRNVHKHDKYSHGADAIRYMVKGGQTYKIPTRQKRISGIDV